MAKIVKKRYWAFVLYLDSAPENWKDILIQRGLPFAVSPYHDKDINPDGSKKKPHYHIILVFDGPTTYSNVEHITKDVLNQTIPIELDSVKGYYRYFTHKDNPEKYQYNEEEITTYNTFDINDILSSSEVFAIMRELQKFIKINELDEYCDLMDILLENELYDLWNVASTHTLYFNTYLTSKRHKGKKTSLQDTFYNI